MRESWQPLAVFEGGGVQTDPGFFTGAWGIFQHDQVLMVIQGITFGGGEAGFEVFSNRFYFISVSVGVKVLFKGIEVFKQSFLYTCTYVALFFVLHVYDM